MKKASSEEAEERSNSDDSSSQNGEESPSTFDEHCESEHCEGTVILYLAANVISKVMFGTYHSFISQPHTFLWSLLWP